MFVAPVAWDWRSRLVAQAGLICPEGGYPAKQTHLETVGRLLYGMSLGIFQDDVIVLGMTTPLSRRSFQLGQF